MKKILLVSAILASLAGCSSDDPEPTAAEITLALLNGTWLSTDCEDLGTGAGGSIQYTFNNGTGEETLLRFANLNCTGTGVADPASNFAYTVGDDVTTNGSVDGITAAHQINMVFDFNAREEYNIFAIKDLASLYLGGNGAATPGARPSQLVDIAYTFQP